MVTSRVVTYIWDHGWLSRDELQFAPAPPSDKDESTIHGPFVRSRIRSDDFVQFEEPALQPYLDQLLLSSEWSEPATAEQCSAVGAALRSAFHESPACYRLRFDETSSELHHEWGFVFTVFRELLFLQPESGHVTRFVIGYE